MPISRRDFIRQMTALGFTVAAASWLYALTGCGAESPAAPPSTTASAPPSGQPLATPADSRLVVARGQSPKAITEAAVRALGGIEQFVKRGDDVIIKPNICVAYHMPEYAATTNPEVVGTMVTLCKNAGARRIRVMDQPFGGRAEEAYVRSGIQEAVRGAGGQMEVMSPLKFKDTPIPAGRDITSWPVYQDVLEADVVINIPIAKHHQLARLTLGMKNLMGVVQNRNQFHFNLGQRIADLNTLVRPRLTIMDAVRILVNNGPSGGNLADVKVMNTVIASRDIVAVDAYAATLFNLTGADIPATRAGAALGLGNMDLKSIKVEEINA